MHKGNKTKLTFMLCEKCGCKKKLVRTAVFQRVGEPSKREYVTQMLKPAEYQFRSPEGKLLKVMPKCIGINYKKYGSMTGQLDIFGREI